MTTYTPPVITNGTPFDGSTVTGAAGASGFDGLSSVLNGDINAANFSGSAILSYRKFQKGRVTETFSSDSTGRPTAVFSSIIYDTAGASPWGPKTNIYDVDHTGVDFYLHAAAKCRFEGLVDLKYSKDYWNVAGHYAGTPDTYGIRWTVELILNGASVGIPRISQLSRHALGFQKVGHSLRISHTTAAVLPASFTAGTHNAFLRITAIPAFDFAAWVAAGNPLPILTQWISPFRSLSVHAIYQ